MVWSSDLITWSAAGVTDSLISNTATSELHEARVPFGVLYPTRGFLRLQVKP